MHLSSVTLDSKMSTNINSADYENIQYIYSMMEVDIIN